MHYILLHIHFFFIVSSISILKQKTAITHFSFCVNWFLLIIMQTCPFTEPFCLNYSSSVKGLFHRLCFYIVATINLYTEQNGNLLPTIHSARWCELTVMHVLLLISKWFVFVVKSRERTKRAINYGDKRAVIDTVRKRDRPIICRNINNEIQ